jgi:NAD(P)-dependent dehydrogenase (short-subunit alcohol dehydrogenase family)
VIVQSHGVSFKAPSSVVVETAEYPLPNFTVDLCGPVALVTGATSGLGWRFAQVLAASGGAVAAVGRRTERLEELSESIVAAGGTCAALPMDVTDSSAVSAALDEAESELGPLTNLVNNAGIPDAQFATKMPMELVDRVLATNLRAPSRSPVCWLAD